MNDLAGSFSAKMTDDDSDDAMKYSLVESHIVRWLDTINDAKC